MELFSRKIKLSCETVLLTNRLKGDFQNMCSVARFPAFLKILFYITKVKVDTINLRFHLFHDIQYLQTCTLYYVSTILLNSITASLICWGSISSIFYIVNMYNSNRQQYGMKKGTIFIGTNPKDKWICCGFCTFVHVVAIIHFFVMQQIPRIN